MSKAICDLTLELLTSRQSDDPAVKAFLEYEEAAQAFEEGVREHDDAEAFEKTDEFKTLEKAFLETQQAFVVTPITSPLGALSKLHYLMRTAKDSYIDPDPATVTGEAVATLHDYLQGLAIGRFPPATKRTLIDGGKIEDACLKISNAAGAAFLVGEACTHDGDASNAAFLVSTVLYETRGQIYETVFGSRPSDGEDGQ